MWPPTNLPGGHAGRVTLPSILSTTHYQLPTTNYRRKNTIGPESALTVKFRAVVVTGCVALL